MKLDNKYERFTVGPTPRFENRIHVTLTAKGRLLINRRAHALLGRPDAIALFYNREDERIAVTSTPARASGAFPLTEASNAALSYITPFLRHYGIKIDGTERFVEPEFDNDGNMHLDLNRTVRVGGHKRRVKRK